MTNDTLCAFSYLIPLRNLQLQCEDHARLRNLLSPLIKVTKLLCQSNKLFASHIETYELC